MLTQLANLSFFTETNIQTSVRALESLDSPLQKLQLKTSRISNDHLNDTTFEPVAKWNVSLHILEITCSLCDDFFMESSPFRWFPNLRLLRLDVFVTIQTFSTSTFRGLDNLEKLQILSRNADLFGSGALQTFSVHNTLKSLNLRHCSLHAQITGDQLCLISSSLQTASLSSNNLVGFTHDLPCKLQNLYDLDIRDQGQQYYPSWSFRVICRPWSTQSSQAESKSCWYYQY